MSQSIFTVALIVIAAISNSNTGECKSANSIDSNDVQDVADDLYLLQTSVDVNTMAVMDANTSLDTKTHAGKRVNASEDPTAEPGFEDSSATSAGTAAEATGVVANEEGDLGIFLTALFSNGVIIGCCIAFFIYFRHRYPDVFEYPLINNLAPEAQVEQGFFDWARRSLKVTTDEVQDHAGLDMAMLLEFTVLGIRMMAYIGLPMFFIMGPMNWIFGGHAAGEDRLSYLSFGNVEDGSWLYWIHCFVVWGVVCTVQVCVYSAMDNFMKHRERWLLELPEVRANTILIEEIPEEHQSDAALKTYFEQIFGEGKIKSARCVKICPELTALVEKKEKLTIDLNKAKFKESKGQPVDPKPQELESEIAGIDQDIKKERKQVNSQADQLGGVNGSVGFVEFYTRQDAEMASTANYSTDIYTWEVSTPPPPQTLMWHHLKQGSQTKAAMVVVGYGLVGGLYLLYLPLVVGITNLATSVNLGPLQDLWEGFAPTLGLQVMVAFLPTFLILIFQMCFPLTDSAQSQQMLQNWYFVFQVVFVILVTAIGSNIVDFMLAIITNPLEMVNILAINMPPATHFYMNFLVLQWTAHFTNLTRYVVLFKYMGFCKFFEKEEAKEMCEPEDQDYYGIGSRSARFTINLVIGIVFGTLSPPICILTLINFMVCRLVYGYLVVFAETRKADLGGEFWVHQLMHIFWGNIIYCIMMTGVLLGRSTSTVPGIIAGSSLGYVLWSYNRFKTRFNWERLPIHEVATGKRKPRDARATFDQPEFID